MSSCSSGETLATPRRGRCLRQRGLRTCTLWFVEARNKSSWPFFLALVGTQLEALVFEINSDLEEGGPVATVPVS